MSAPGSQPSWAQLAGFSQAPGEGLLDLVGLHEVEQIGRRLPVLEHVRLAQARGHTPAGRRSRAARGAADRDGCRPGASMPLRSAETARRSLRTITLSSRCSIWWRRGARAAAPSWGTARKHLPYSPSSSTTLGGGGWVIEQEAQGLLESPGSGPRSWPRRAACTSCRGWPRAAAPRRRGSS